MINNLVKPLICQMSAFREERGLNWEACVAARGSTCEVLTLQRTEGKVVQPRMVPEGPSQEDRCFSALWLPQETGIQESVLGHL